MKKILLSTLSLFLLSLPTSVRAQEVSPLQQAMADYDYRTALALMADEEPTEALLFQKATALKGLGRTREALRTYHDILAGDSLSVRAHIEAAECCKQLSMQRPALEHYRQALALNPRNTYARIQHIRLLLAMRRYAPALDESRHLMQESDTSAVALHLEAQSLEGLKDIVGAAKCYALIQSRWPDDYLSTTKLANLCIDQQDYGQAIALTERYRATDSLNISVNRQNAMAYCLSQNYPMAIRRYEELLALGDSSFYTCYNLGLSYYAQEMPYEARDILETALRENPRDVNLLYYLGRTCARTSRKDDGISYMKQAIEYGIPADSTVVRLYVGLTDCYKQAHRWADHLELLKFRYRNYEPDNHRLLYNIAFDYCFPLQQPDEAERYLEAFLKTRPANRQAAAPVIKNGEIVADDIEHLYNAAESWLESLRTRNRTEKFFQGEIPE